MELLALSHAAQQAIVIAIILLNAYCFGANCVERFVNYQTWPNIDRASFQAYHRAQAALIRIVVVVPLGITFALQLLFLTFHRQTGVPGAIPWTMAGSSLIGTLSTLLLQLPVHRQLSASGYSPERMHRLLTTDWLRKACDLVRMLATILLLRQTLAI
jgi:hypothetical protein